MPEFSPRASNPIRKAEQRVIMQQVAVRREWSTGPQLPVPTPADNAMAAVEQSGEFLAFVIAHSEGQWRVGTSKRLRARK